MTAYRFEFSEPAEAELDEAFRFMAHYGRAAAEAWLRIVKDVLRRECELQAAVRLRHPPARERFPGRDVFALTFATPGGSPWRLLCELADTDGDGERDTLRVVGVRHAAAGENAPSTGSGEKNDAG